MDIFSKDIYNKYIKSHILYRIFLILAKDCFYRNFKYIFQLLTLYLAMGYSLIA